MPTINIDEFQKPPQNCKPKSIDSVFHDKYNEYKSDKSVTSSIKQYFTKIKSYLGSIIYTLRASGESNINLRKKINFVSSIGSDKKRLMNSNSDNVIS